MAASTRVKKVVTVAAKTAPQSRPKVATKAVAKAPVKKPTIKQGGDFAASTKPGAKRSPLAAKTPVPAKVAVPSAKPLSANAKSTSQDNSTIKPKTRPTEKVKKAKLVRDSFTMPEAEYAALSEVKKACLKAGFDVKKSELLRIGVALVRKMAMAVLKQEVSALAPLKPGRPPKQK